VAKAADDEAWCFLKRDDLAGFNMREIEELWHVRWFGSTSYATTCGSFRKAWRKACSNRANTNYCRFYKEDELFFVMWCVNRSRVKEGLWVLLVFEVSVGKDYFPPELIGATCRECTAGEHHPACSHTMTALRALGMIQAGTLIAGEVGDDHRSWEKGHAKSFVRVQKINTISLLNSSGHLPAFSGIRADAPPLQSRMTVYCANRKRLAGDGDTRQLVELHYEAKERARKKRQPT